MSNKPLKCSQEIRNMPLEAFRPVCHGRKWKQTAGSLSDFLYRVSGYANPDGTFIREGVDYSPTFKTLRKRYAKASLIRWSDACRELGFLSWTREKHRERRSYLLHMDKIRAAILAAQVSDSSEQVSDSHGTGLTFAGNRSHIGQEQVSHSRVSGLTIDPHPSSSVFCPSLPPTTVTAADS